MTSGLPFDDFRLLLQTLPGPDEAAVAAVRARDAVLTKPRGALGRLEEIAQAVCDAADVFRVPLLGMTGTLHETVYPARGHRMIAEYYGDLDYRPDGTLIVTREHDAKDPDEMAARVLRAIAQGEGTATDGSHFPTRCESICIHSDTPNALDIARMVRAAIAPYSERRT